MPSTTFSLTNLLSLPFLSLSSYDSRNCCSDDPQRIVIRNCRSLAATVRKQRSSLFISRRCHHEIQCEDRVHWAAGRSSSRCPFGGCHLSHPSSKWRNESPGRAARAFDRAEVDRVCERGERGRVELDVGFRRCAVRVVDVARRRLGAVGRRRSDRHDLQPYRALRWHDLLLYSARGGRQRPTRRMVGICRCDRV